MTSPRICFVAERQVGIGSAAAALEPHARGRANGVWVDVTYFRQGGLIERLSLPGRMGGTLRGFQQTGDALRGGPFDALFFLTHNPAVLHQQAIGRTPTLLWTDVTPAQLDAQASLYAHPLDRRWPTRVIKRALVRRAFHRAALCVGWSDWARRSFMDDYGVPRAKTAVVPPGIDLTRWVMPARRGQSDLPRLLFIGGDFRRKGGELLLDVFRDHLRGRCALDIVTRDPIPEEDGVRIYRGVGPGSPVMLGLFHAASAFVLPTLGDCFSMATIEAMAMGLPVIVSDVGGISEIVEPGVSGHLIQPGDGRSLRDALEALLSNGDLRQSMGGRGRALVEERFDARKTSEQLFHLLERIASSQVPC
jgi:glycosyltransferase involved in cell wall biosynthesis